MALTQNTDPAPPRKLFLVAAPGGDGTPPPAPSQDKRPLTPRSPTRHLNVDQYVRLLACIEREGGIATLDEISHALPMVERPISAVFDLCDAGVLGADLEACFDGDMRVWRIDE